MVAKRILNPEKLKNTSEISDVISLIEEFENLNQTPAVVVLRQNRSFGGSYSIIPESEARNNLQKWRGSDIYIKLWSKQYFIDLQKKYSG